MLLLPICPTVGKDKFKSLHTSYEQVTYTYWASVSSFANGVIIASLDGYVEDWELMYVKQCSVALWWHQGGGDY